VSADAAINDLLNFSTDIRGVAVLAESGEVAAASPQVSAAELQAAASALWSAAEASAAGTDAAPLEHVLVRDESGAVCLLRKDGRSIVAVTGPQPAVGLLLFDLRTCLSDAYPGEQP
jgi:predicted regulator of Ras-like GTPase activity (Roadblock/LC7/MglB family)